MSTEKPPARHVGSWRAAEQLAADWLVYLGYEDARLTGSGPDGGVDVRSARALAQVKFKAAQVGAPDLQRLFGARGTAWGQDLLFFSGSSFSAKALAYAEDHEIALFTYDLTGAVQPVSTIARVFLSEAERRDARSALPEDAARITAGRTSDGRSARADSGSGWVTSPDLRDIERRVAAQGPVAQCLLAGAILFMPATLALVGLGALLAGAEHVGWAVVLGIVGLGAWLFGLSGVAEGTAGARRHSRFLGALAVVVTTGPAVAL